MAYQDLPSLNRVMQEAIWLYGKISNWKQQPDQSVFNALLRLSARVKAHQLPLSNLYQRMLDLRVEPNEYTCSAVFQAATTQGVQSSGWLFNVSLGSAGEGSFRCCIYRV